MSLEDRKKPVKKINKTNLLLNKYLPFIKIAVLIIAFVLMILIVIIPKYQASNQTKESILEQKTKELEDLKVYYDNLKNLNIDINEFKKLEATNLKKLNEVLPSEAAIPELMAQLEAVTLSSGFSLSYMDFTQGALFEEEKDSLDSTEEIKNDSTPGIHFVDIAMSVQGGDYFGLKKLLNNLEKHLRILDVMALTFSGGQEANGYSLALRTYYFIP